MKPISKDWTPEERIRVVLAYLPAISFDIHVNRYGERGGKTLATIRDFLTDSPEILELHRARIEKTLADWETEGEPRGLDPDE